MCSHDHHRLQNFFTIPKQKLYPLNNKSIYPFPSASCNLYSTSCLCEFAYSYELHINGITIFVFLCLTSLNNVLKIHPCCGTHKNCNPFYGFIFMKIHFMYVPHFVYSCVDGRLGCFHLLTVPPAAMNVDVQVSV